MNERYRLLSLRGALKQSVYLYILYFQFIFESGILVRIVSIPGYSRQSEDQKKISVGIFEYILASMLKVFLNM